MGKVLVLGIGNKLMMDDGIGICLVEELAKRNMDPSITYCIGESDVDYSLQQVEGASFVIVVDAVRSGSKTGEISVYSLGDLHECRTLDISPHNLHLFQVLHQQSEKTEGYLIGIEPFEVSFHIGLSNTIKEKWDEILSDVSKIIERLIAKNKTL
jgi:hydrogenase maturation protease